MAATIAEKIFSQTCGRAVHAGDVVMAPVDAAMVHDITGPLAVRVFREMGGEQVFDPERIIMLFDSRFPPTRFLAADHVFMRRFAEEQDPQLRLTGCLSPGGDGEGRAAPGEIIVGVDSHTCTYGAAGRLRPGSARPIGFDPEVRALYFRVPESIRVEVGGAFPRRVGAKDLILSLAGDIGADGATYRALEFDGPAMHSMDMAGRMTCANMAIEMGAKAGIVQPDATTWDYVTARRDVEPFDLAGDSDAAYAEDRHYSVTDLAPQVAVPHNVDNVVSVDEVAGTRVDQVFIGSCTNGRYEDLASAAEVLGDADSFAAGVRVIIIPASRTEYLRALRAGFIERFVEAGALVEAPCCGPCMGGAFGLLAPGEVSLSTSNRNFRGRQGSAQASVYLSSPATAAASALR